MSDYRLKLAMSQNGRGSRDQHSVVLRVEPLAAFSRPNAKQLSLDLAAAFAAVMFTATTILRATFTELDANSKAVPYSSFSVPLSVLGRTSFEDDDGSAEEGMCLAIEKSSDKGKPGVTLLRHCLSAKEHADVTLGGPPPTRFTSSAVGTYNAGHSLAANIMKALTDNNFKLKLPPLKIGGVWVERVVDTIAAQDFRYIKVTKTRTSAMSKIAKGVQQAMNDAARKAWNLWKKYGPTGPADIVTAIRTLITDAWAAYNDLVAIERALVKPPTFPALPAP